MLIVISIVCDCHSKKYNQQQHQKQQQQHQQQHQHGDQRTNDLKSMSASIKSKWPNGKVGNKKSDEITGDGYDFIVYDCEEPIVNGKGVTFNSRQEYVSQMETVKENSEYECDPKDSTWRRTSDSAYVTFNIESNSFDHFVELDTLETMRSKNMCNSLMNFFRHPWYIQVQRIKKPEECKGENWKFAKSQG